MNISEENRKLLEQIEEIINSEQFSRGDPHVSKRLIFLANHSLPYGSYAREKLHEIGDLAGDFAKAGSNRNLIFAKIKDRLSRIKAELTVYEEDA